MNSNNRLHGTRRWTRAAQALDTTIGVYIIYDTTIGVYIIYDTTIGVYIIYGTTIGVYIIYDTTIGVYIIYDTTKLPFIIISGILPQPNLNRKACEAAGELLDYLWINCSNKFCVINFHG